MSTNKSIGRDELLGATVARTFEMVPLPELGKDKSIRVRSLLAKEYSDYEDSIRIKTKKGYDIDPVHLQEKLIVKCAVNDQGEPLFNEEDMSKLAGLPASVISRIFKSAQALCGLNEDPEELQERLKVAQG